MTSDNTTPCWYVEKENTTEWVKFFDVGCAIHYAKVTGGIMRYAADGMNTRAEMPVTDAEMQEALVSLERMYDHVLTADFDAYWQIHNDHETISRALSALAPQPIDVDKDFKYDIVREIHDALKYPQIRRAVESTIEEITSKYTLINKVEE